MTDFDQVRKLASRATDVISLCLAGDLVEQLADLNRQLEAAPAPTNLGDTTRRDLAERIVALQDQMRESTVDFRLRALPARQWDPLWAAVPDRIEGEAPEAYAERLFPYYTTIVSRTVVDPAMTPEQVADLVDDLSSGTWNRLARRCVRVNLGEVDVPNSEAASALIEDFEQT
jgi:hypothetical protein